MIFPADNPAQKQPDYVFRPEYQERLKDYCLHRAEQLRAFLSALEFWGVGHTLDHYFRGLRLVCEEIDNPINDSELKSRNCSWLLSSNDCNRLFGEDTYAIIHGQEPPLPDDISLIPAYLAEVEKQRREAEEKRQLEIQLRENERMCEIRRREAAEEKQRCQEELANQLGISIKTLERLQSEG